MDYAAIIARQRAFFRSGRTLDAGDRCRNLRALLEAVEANEQILFESLHADLRKNAHDAFASELAPGEAFCVLPGAYIPVFCIVTLALAVLASLAAAWRATCIDPAEVIREQ
jgi:hypothetical protein